MKKLLSFLLALTLLLTALAVPASAARLARNAWIQNGTDWYYYDAAGNLLKNGMYYVDGAWYYFNTNGVMAHNVAVTQNGTAYLFGQNGAWTGVSTATPGWIVRGGKTYYATVDPRGLIYFYRHGTFRIDGQQYAFRNYELLTGGWYQPWIDDANPAWVYANGNSTLATGWTKIGKEWYFFAENGAMYANQWASGAGGTRKYFMKGDGTIATGWQDVRLATGSQGPDWRFFSADGVMQVGWLKDGGSWYYLNPADGKMVANALWEIDREVYAFDASGKIARGWWRHPVTGDYYYSAADGIYFSRWLKDGGAWYYLGENGIMMANGSATIGGVTYTFGPSGALIQ